MSGSYIYILHEREFLVSGEELYKIGRTEDIIRRFQEFPKGSQLKFMIDVPTDKVVNMETKILRIFRKKYTQREDIGTEYFAGNIKCMMQSILGFANGVQFNNDNNQITTNHLDETKTQDGTKTHNNIKLVSYACPRCNYTTSHCSHIRGHFDRKKMCQVRNKGLVALTQQVKDKVIEGSYLRENDIGNI